eukprot:3749172-Rhodomonas_salina.3
MAVQDSFVSTDGKFGFVEMRTVQVLLHPLSCYALATQGPVLGRRVRYSQQLCPTCYGLYAATCVSYTERARLVLMARMRFIGSYERAKHVGRRLHGPPHPRRVSGPPLPSCSAVVCTVAFVLQYCAVGTASVQHWRLYCCVLHCLYHMALAVRGLYQAVLVLFVRAGTDGRGGLYQAVLVLFVRAGTNGRGEWYQEAG